MRCAARSGSYEFSLPVPKYLTANLALGGLGDAVAPMPGVIEKVMVEAGSSVNAGEPLVVMIAMKMEYVIKAPKSGVISRVNNAVGDFVAKNKERLKRLFYNCIFYNTFDSFPENNAAYVNCF